MVYMLYEISFERVIPRYTECVCYVGHKDNTAEAGMLASPPLPAFLSDSHQIVHVNLIYSGQIERFFLSWVLCLYFFLARANKANLRFE